MRSEPILQLRDVNAGYGSGARQVYDRISLDIACGEILGVTGVSGSGKTTLLRMLAGVLRPRSGAITSPRPLSLAYCPQEDVILDFRSVWENAALLLESPEFNSLAENAFIRAEEVLHEAELAAVHDQMPPTLSGGMRQRLQVIQAVIAGAELLLLDEPFVQQDRDHQRALETLVFDDVRNRQSTAVIVSHDVDGLAAMCDRTIFIGGDPARIVSQIRTPPALRRKGGDGRRASPRYLAFAETLWARRAEASAA